MFAMSKTRSNALAFNPFRHFSKWFSEAKKDPRLDLPEAMCLSTLNARGYPTARMVLLKDHGAEGFTFFTNVHSPKAQQLIQRPHAALTFHWRSQKRQIRIEGRVTHLPKRVADDYFDTRPRESQLGSWASKQSQPLKSRAELIKRFEMYEKLFKGKKVPPSPHWHGFQVIPERMEFWQEAAHRLHDRWGYVRGKSGRWAVTRLYP